MARLSLWNKTKNKDYHFFDRSIREMITIGGTAFLVHKYIGTHQQQTNDKDLTTPFYPDDLETNIQDVLLLENRDRKYDPDLYELRGVYTVSDNDFDLSQFGIFLTSDVIYVEFHLNEMIEMIGRKLMSGDVLELPHLKDDTLLSETLDDELGPVIPKLYKIDDANRASAGFSQSWWPHLWRVKISPLTDSQEFRDILGDGSEEDDLKNLLSTFNKEIEISDAIRDEAERQVPNRNTEHAHLYVSEECDNGIPFLFMTDGEPPNGATLLGQGSEFPASPPDNSWFLRTDYEPNVLFRKEGSKWIRKEVDWRRKFTTANRVLQRFVDNRDKVQTSRGEIDSKVGISQAVAPRIKPKPDEIV